MHGTVRVAYRAVWVERKPEFGHSSAVPGAPDNPVYPLTVRYSDPGATSDDDESYEDVASLAGNLEEYNYRRDWPEVRLTDAHGRPVALIMSCCRVLQFRLATADDLGGVAG